MHVRLAGANVNFLQRGVREPLLWVTRNQEGEAWLWNSTDLFLSYTVFAVAAKEIQIFVPTTTRAAGVVDAPPLKPVCICMPAIKTNASHCSTLWHNKLQAITIFAAFELL